MLEAWKDMAETDVFATHGDTVSLIGIRCSNCGRQDFPAVPFCRNCLSEDVVPTEFESEGSVYAFSTIHTGTEPYTVGYADLPIGLRVFGQMVGEVAIGDTVSVTRAELPVTFERTGR
jgi:uncharacterized OB-fold protein